MGRCSEITGAPAVSLLSTTTLTLNSDISVGSGTSWFSWGRKSARFSRTNFDTSVNQERSLGCWPRRAYRRLIRLMGAEITARPSCVWSFRTDFWVRASRRRAFCRNSLTAGSRRFRRPSMSRRSVSDRPS